MMTAKKTGDDDVMKKSVEKKNVAILNGSGVCSAISVAWHHRNGHQLSLVWRENDILNVINVMATLYVLSPTTVIQ